jgi:hypothetical protein
MHLCMRGNYFFSLSEVEEIGHKPPDTVDLKKSEIYKKV